MRMWNKIFLQDALRKKVYVLLTCFSCLQIRRIRTTVLLHAALLKGVHC